MTLRAVLPWGVALAAIGVALWALSDRPAPPGPTTVAIESPQPDSPIPGPDLGPEEPAPTPPPPETSAPAPAPAPAPAVPTGLEVSRGSITMRELEDPRTGERFFRVANRDLAPALPVQIESQEPDPAEPAAATIPETPEPTLALDEEPAAEEAAPPLSEDDLRRIVREELAARDEEQAATHEQDVQTAREAALASYVADTGLSARDTKELRSVLEHEVGVIEATRAAMLQRELTPVEAWRKLDKQRRETEKALRNLLGERGYALYHEQGIGEALTGMWTLHTNLREPLTNWR